MEEINTQTEVEMPQNSQNSQNTQGKQKKPINSGLIVLIVIFALALLSGIIRFATAPRNSFESTKPNFSGKYTAILNIEGTISEENETYNQKWLLNTIKQLKQDKNNIGAILFINSPGGTVYEADEVYLELCDYAEEKQLWAYLGQMAASGGYYIACAADSIIANRNTLTGSIGVIAGKSLDLTQFLSKNGIKVTTITAGKNKNMMNIDAPFTEEQKAIMQSVADECYEQFTQIVSDSRSIPLEKVVSLADGRIYTAAQAKRLGLIDEISSFEDTKEMFSEKSSYPKATFKEFKYEKDKNFYNYILDMKSLVKPQSMLDTDLLKNTEIKFPSFYYEQ